MRTTLVLDHVEIYRDSDEPHFQYNWRCRECERRGKDMAPDGASASRMGFTHYNIWHRKATN